MTSEEIDRIREALRERGIVIDEGLREEELRGLEEDFGFRFPPDLAELLRTFVPQGADFPNWHAAHDQDLIEWFGYPADGIAFDVEENGFWFAGWGAKPDDVDDAVEEAVRHVAVAPILVPLHAQKFIPAMPSQAGNPVFAVNQSEVAVWATDLREFFEKEFGVELPRRRKPEARRIELWSELAAHR